jgi:hypothetical protein
MTQTNVKFIQDRAYPGTLAASNGGGVIRGALRRFYNRTVNNIKYGKVVVLATGSTTNIELPVNNTKTPIGLVIYNEFVGNSFPLLGSDDNQGVKPDQIASIYTGGFDDWWVRVDNGVTVAPGDNVFYRFTTSGLLEAGDVSNATSAAHAQWTGVRFVTPNYLIANGTVNIAAINLSDTLL